MTERVALVTGAGRGLGRVMALALLRAGHRVHVTGRRFIAARWNPALTDAQAAQAAGAPAAWGGHRDSSIRPPDEAIPSRAPA